MKNSNVELVVRNKSKLDGNSYDIIDEIYMCINIRDEIFVSGLKSSLYYDMKETEVENKERLKEAMLLGEKEKVLTSIGYMEDCKYIAIATRIINNLEGLYTDGLYVRISDMAMFVRFVSHDKNVWISVNETDTYDTVIDKLEKSSYYKSDFTFSNYKTLGRTKIKELLDREEVDFLLENMSINLGIQKDTVRYGEYGDSESKYKSQSVSISNSNGILATFAEGNGSGNSLVVRKAHEVYSHLQLFLEQPTLDFDNYITTLFTTAMMDMKRLRLMTSK